MLGGIAALAGLLLAAGWARVGETRTAPAARQPMLRLARRMLRDPELLCTAMLVAGLNLLAFSFYAAGPFMTGPLPWLGFGWIGMAVALAGTLGALWNRRLPASQGPARRVALGLCCVAVGVAAQGLAIWLAPMPGLWWAVAALPIFAGYGMAIPNLLGPALRRYGDCLAGPARCSAWATACWGCCWRRRRGCLSARPCRWRWPGRGDAGPRGPASAARQADLSFAPRRHARRYVLRRVPQPH